MDSVPEEIWPKFEVVTTAVEYLYFWRNWWVPPEGNDVVIFWKDEKGVCRRYCSATGESSWWDESPKSMKETKIVFDDEIPIVLFENLMKRANSANMLSIRAVNPVACSGHCLDHYGIRWRHKWENKFVVPGSMLLGGDDANRFQKIFEGTHGLRDFYREQRRKRR